MKLYEYKEIPRTVPNLTEAFNEVGKDGWELVMKEDGNKSPPKLKRFY